MSLVNLTVLLQSIPTPIPWLLISTALPQSLPLQTVQVTRLSLLPLSLTLFPTVLPHPLQT